MISQDSSARNHPSDFQQPAPRNKVEKKRRILLIAISFLLLFGVAGGSFLALNLVHLGAAHAASSASAVTTYKGNNARLGQYSNETTLHTGNVSVNQFGKRVTYPVDGQVYAEPLYLPNITINGTSHNVVFVETEHDSIYAFDADQTTPTAPLWQTSFLSTGVTPASNLDVSCNDMVPEIGITSTPVIDSTSNTLYLVALTKENGSLVYRLHALDITTGQDKPGSPTIISGSVTGTGRGSVGGKVAFNPQYERQRSALLQVNGQVYVAFASFCDVGSYHGWIMSYGYNETAGFQQTHIYNNTPDGVGGGIWGGNGALAADSTGNIYTVSGNGDFNLNTGGKNAGDSFVKLNPDLSTASYFAPFNQLCLQQADADLGSGGPILIPNTNEIIGAGKEGRVYVIDRNNMGQFTADPTLNCNSAAEKNRVNVDKIHQELPPNTIGGMYSTPVYWNGTVYFTGVNDHTKAFTYNFSTNTLNTTPSAQTPESFKFTGGDAVLSSNGTNVGTGILWAIDPLGILRAYDASNISNEIYNSSQNSTRDGLDSYVKFTTPTVANGEVFVGTKTSLNIYGLLKGTPQPTPTATTTGTVTPTPTPTGTPTSGGAVFNNAGISDDTNPGAANFDGGHRSYSAQELRNNGINAGDNTFYNKMVFTWPDITTGSPDNYVAQGQTVNVTPVNGANILGFLGSSSGGPTYGTAVINYTDGSHQSFFLGFSDWTLGGGNAPVSFGNGKMATLNYRNSATGFQTVTNYIFYADVLMQSGKTVQSVTLPTTTTGGLLHVFAISTKQGTVSTTGDASAPFNNIGTSNDSAPTSASFDSKDSYSAQAMQSAGLIPGGSVNAYGTTFFWPGAAAGTANNFIPQGQVIPINPVSNAQTIAFLGSATYGNTQGSATVTFSDDTTQNINLAFSDWTLGGGKNMLATGNLVAATMPYRNTPTGKQTLNTMIFYVEYALPAGKTVQSVTLPTVTTGGQMHVFTVSTKDSAPFPVSAYNNAGTSDDSAPAGAGLDGKYSYSAQALSSVGLAPGSLLTINGGSFVWPGGIGQNNNYQTNGQVVPVNSVYGSTVLAILGASTGGPSSGQATITYADGKTQQVTLGFSDWTLGGGNQQVSYGNLIAATSPYRNSPAGKQSVKAYVYDSEFALIYNEPVVSITLPNVAQLHVFSVTTH
ncbi:hypothetical protein [Dictyobacter kobayashii]|uniref:Pyrrolo-quinoline quinone n=1 Tax=Dictyobacter kobayashii TaxID=2014872 RepID=A0A402AIE6_9CHLR|nr:hypothetical protein [Dictyobacter kobayashii]GCE18892.1 hypothetical protein KDK_26920 [Dictyobacter kobayashii]